MLKGIKKTNFWMIALIFVALAWGTSYAITKDTLNGIKPFQFMAMRFGLSTILLTCLFGRHLKNLSKRDLYHSLVIGIFMFCGFITLITGISYTTASKQSFLVGSYVLIVPLFSWVINRNKLDLYTILRALLATIGIGLITLNSRLHINKGDLISIFCALSFACHMICIDYFNKETDPKVSGPLLNEEL
jgi:drug/metabolite transporter (DMT)-like permease